MHQIISKFSEFFNRLLIFGIIVYFFLGLLLFNLDSPLQYYFTPIKFFTSYLHIDLQLSGMYAAQENSLAESRIIFESSGGESALSYGRRYRWLFSKNPFLIGETRLSYYQNIPFGYELFNGFTRYWCKYGHSNLGFNVHSIRNEVRELTIGKILRSKGEEPFDADWKTRWSHVCNTKTNLRTFQ